MKHTINIKPVPKPRQTRSDVWKKRPCVIRYREFADQLRDNLKNNNIDPLVNGNISCLFILEMPKSWSDKKKKQYEGKPHESKPDIDNLIKSVLDALRQNDSKIHTIIVTKKVWGYSNSITFYY